MPPEKIRKPKMFSVNFKGDKMGTLGRTRSIFCCRCWTWSIERFAKRLDYFNSPAGIYLLKVNNRNIGMKCEICPNLTLKTSRTRSVLSARKSLKAAHIHSAQNSRFHLISGSENFLEAQRF